MSEKRTVELSFLCQLPLWAIWAGLVALGMQVASVRLAIERRTTMLLCVESWKNGIEPAHCSEMLVHRQQERPE